MATSSDSENFWKIFAIGVTTVALLLAVATYFGWAEAAKERSAALTQTAAAKDAETKFAQKDADLQSVKQIVGHEFSEVNGGPNSVVGAITNDLQQFGGTEQQNTVTATMAAMRAKADSLAAENASLQANLAERDERLRTLEAAYQNRVQEAMDSQKGSETELQTNIRRMEDDIARKDEELAGIRKAFETAQVETETIRDSFEQYRSRMEKEYAKVEKLAEDRGFELNEAKKVSFEREDGVIRSTSPLDNTVTINLGELDGLPEQTTFSVYKRNNSGIARGVEDIKGAIEVTRILGPHQAEARILEQDKYDPISKGDLVYSPVWEAGRTEYFAFVGLLDIDGDGRDDRQLLERIIQNQGGKVEFFVDENGNRVPEGAEIESRTKFLVLGDTPNLSRVPVGDPAREGVMAVRAAEEQLRKEALREGKRVLSLGDFLSFLGYRPTQRLYDPTSGGDYNIRDGKPLNSQRSRTLIDRLPQY